MSSGMQIELNWLPPFHGTEEVSRTSAEIQIRFGEENATRFEDSWSKSVQQAARVSAYPLALWLASSWWRIRWEPRPRILLGEDATVDWRMSHEIPAAGYGFIWPQLSFASDGESIAVACHPDSALSEPVRFLSDFTASVPSKDFEKATDDFIDLVLRRLDALGKTELHQLWEDVLSERAEPHQAAARRLEARLGFDPDEAPSQLLEDLLLLAPEAGLAAVDEIASVCAGRDPAATFGQVKELAARQGLSGRISLSPSNAAADNALLPWERGRRMANALRGTLRLGSGPLTDERLGDLLQIAPEHLKPASEDISPMGLAVRGEGEALKLLFRKRNRPGRRFEAARIIADHLHAEITERWLPITDATTARQKVQRAFAAEFLCPIESLREYVQDDFLPEAFEEAADYFGVSEMAVQSQLVNHQLLPRDYMAAEGRF